MAVTSVVETESKTTDGSAAEEFLPKKYSDFGTAKMFCILTIQLYILLYNCQI